MTEHTDDGNEIVMTPENARLFAAACLRHSIGRAIREFRYSKNMTQKELAALLRTSQPQVHNLENGRQFPSLPTLLRVAEVFGKTLVVEFK